MTNLLDPVGPLPPGVYWRRRAVVLVVLVALVFVSMKACGGSEPKQIRATGQANAVPTATATASPTARPTVSVVATTAPPATSSPTATRPAAPATCAPTAVQVHIDADDNYYRKSVKPKLKIVAANVGTVPCLLDIGSKTIVLVITSGRDRIWSSADCLTKGTSERRLLQPRQQVGAEVVWNRVRSKPGCPAEVPTAKAGTYLVDGQVAGVRAIRRDFFLLA